MTMGLCGDLFVPIRRPVLFDYRARPRCAWAVGVFCYSLPRCFCSLSLRGCQIKLLFGCGWSGIAFSMAATATDSAPFVHSHAFLLMNFHIAAPFLSPKKHKKPPCFMQGFLI